VRFIVGSRVTKAPTDLASHFRWHGDAFTDGQVIDTITPRVATAAARSVNDSGQAARAGVGPHRSPQVVASGVGVLGETCRPRRQDVDPAGEPRQSRRRRREGRPHTTIRHLKNGSRVLDEASLARARRLVGLKGYVTNIPVAVMPAAEVIASYHDLWHVEASFRMSKATCEPARSSTTPATRSRPT
jgi:hypothetical protein